MTAAANELPTSGDLLTLANRYRREAERHLLAGDTGAALDATRTSALATDLALVLEDKETKG